MVIVSRLIFDREKSQARHRDMSFIKSNKFGFRNKQVKKRENFSMGAYIDVRDREKSQARRRDAKFIKSNKRHQN